MRLGGWRSGKRNSLGDAAHRYLKRGVLVGGWVTGDTGDFKRRPCTLKDRVARIIRGDQERRRRVDRYRATDNGGSFPVGPGQFGGPILIKVEARVVGRDESLNPDIVSVGLDHLDVLDAALIDLNRRGDVVLRVASVDFCRQGRGL